MNSLKSQAKKGMVGFVKTLTEVCPKLDMTFEVTEEDEEQVSFDIDGIPFTLSWGESPTPAIGGMRWQVIYQLCVWSTTMGTRHEPPEMIDTTLVDSAYVGQCTRKALETVFMVRVDGVLENQGYAEMLAEEKNLEQI
jgi:hypothetical protein